MFNHSVGAQIFGSNLCNAGGDIILHNSDLRVRGPYAAGGQPALSLSALPMGNVSAAGVHPGLALQGHESDFAPPAEATFEFDPGEGSWREGGGVVRNARRGMTGRQAPYDSGRLSIRHLFNDGGPPSSCSNSLIPSHRRLTRPIQTPQFRCPSFEDSSPQPYTNPDYAMSNPQSQYPFMDPNTNNTMVSHQDCVPTHVPYLVYGPAGAAAHSAAYFTDGGGTPHEDHLLQEVNTFYPYPAQSFHNSNILSAQTIINGQHVNNHGESGIHILHRAVALEALFDSAESFPQPRCHPETRTAMLDDLYDWALQDEYARPIRWLHGPAGAGKSAIMQTLCQKLHSAGNLGGAFFFKRDHPTRGNARVLFATLAYQLALNVRQLKPLISESVESDPSVVARQMDVQLQELIVEPCQTLRHPAPLVLLIDGLDECDTRGAQVEILRSIRTAVLRHQKIRLLIASRPEAHISDVFEDGSFDEIWDSQDVEESFRDVWAYFNDEFNRIHREHHHTMSVFLILSHHPK
ncbi:hypothetical protein DFH06DRAFT_1119217 [Mycena polygramma]|nr:hypothetical protein DFH06DRAFT_1119217 [Mycena polygramma]